MVSGGTSSIAIIPVCSVPPEMPPFIERELVHWPASASGPNFDFKNLTDRYAETSEGTESNPHEGTIIAPVFVAK